MKPRTFAFLVSALAALAGCKQGLGDRCQIDDDCESGLKCGMQNTCYNPAIVLSDASVNLGDAKIIYDSPFPADAAAVFADAAPADARSPVADAPPVAADAADQTPDAAGAGKPGR